MLKIRPEQLKTLEQKRRPKFEDYMVRHLGEHFPQHVRLWGPERTAKVVRGGVKAARGHEFQSDHDLCLYVDLCVMLGIGFDTDVQLRWAQEILSRTDITAPTERVERLYDAALAYLDKVVGADEVFPVAAYRKLCDYSLDESAPRLEAQLRQGILGELRRIWPQKYRQVGAGRLGRLVDEGIRAAGGYGFTEARHVGYYLILMYVFGHQFDGDPQYRWAVPFLTDERAGDARQRMERLISRVCAVLGEVLT